MAVAMRVSVGVGVVVGFGEGRTAGARGSGAGVCALGHGVGRVGVLGVGGMSSSEPTERVPCLVLVPLARVVTGWGVGGSVAAVEGDAVNVVGVGVLGAFGLPWGDGATRRWGRLLLAWMRGGEGMAGSGDRVGERW